MTETLDPLRVLHGRHGSEIYPSGSEAFLRPSKHVWGIWLALLGLIASPNSPNRGFSLPPSAHPPLLLTHPLIHATCDIIVVVIKYTQNPAVLAS